MTDAEIAQMMKFYNVDNKDALIEAQVKHIESLQAKLPANPVPWLPTRPREG